MGLFEKAMAGLGKGMAAVGDMQLKAQIEDMRQRRLAEYEQARAVRDRGWHVEDREQDRAWKEEDWDKTKAWDREKLGIQHGNTMSEIGARSSAAIREHKAKAEYDKANGKDRELKSQTTDAEGRVWNVFKDGTTEPAMGTTPNTEWRPGAAETFDGQDTENLRKRGLMNKGETAQLKQKPAGDKPDDEKLNVRGIPTTMENLNKRYNSWVDAQATSAGKILAFRDWLVDVEGWDPKEADQVASSPDKGKSGGRLKVGDIVNGYKFTGADPADPRNPNNPKNWESVR